jgi:hypothetical protein
MKNKNFVSSGVRFQEGFSHTHVNVKQVYFKVWKHIASGKIKLFC